MQANKIILLLIAFCAIASADRWVVTWQDEFNGNHIDNSKWNFERGNNNGWGNNELEYYTNRPQNAFIRNGNLVIRAVKENFEGFQYTSARMTTQNKFHTVYGKFEVRAKLPQGQGVWPAFWLLGQNIAQVGWPACGEIDIMELIGKDPKHNHGSTHQPGADTTSAYTDNGGFHNNYHVYAANWQPGKIEFSVDGHIYNTVTRANTNGNWVFDGNQMFILLNLAVGGNWPGNPDGSSHFPQELIVDYVRVYEKAQ